jgi:hypothetical protein
MEQDMKQTLEAAMTADGTDPESLNTPIERREIRDAPADIIAQVTRSAVHVGVRAGNDHSANSEEPVPIALDSLMDDEGNFRPVQVRARVDDHTVADYAEAMRAGETENFPPIVVYEVTDREGMRYVAAGLHRCTAARQAGLTTFHGYLRQGTWHEALEAAVKTNATHGHRPTMDDVCATLLQMEGDTAMRDLSNHAKARLIGTSEGTIRNAYKHLEATAQVTRSDTVTVTRKDGTTYQLPKPATAQVTQSSAEDDGEGMPNADGANDADDADGEARTNVVKLDDRMPYGEMLVKLMEQVRAIGALVDANTANKGLTPAVFATLAKDLGAVQVADVCHGGRYVSELCERLKSQLNPRAGRKAS